jgi:hypothetical protein
MAFSWGQLILKMCLFKYSGFGSTMSTEFSCRRTGAHRMPTFLHILRARALTAAICCTFVSTLAGETRMLTFGGGSDPSHNEISLEKNILYFQQALSDLEMGQMSHDIFFADAGASDKTVEFKVDLSRDQQWTDFLATLFGQERTGEMRYRRVELTKLAGPSNVRELRRWFNTTGKALRPMDELVFYFTGHGGADEQRGANPPRNTTLAMWDSQDCSVRQFARELDKLDPAVEVTLVMVQCHAGGFANVIYNDADPLKGFSNHKRCGFFATSASRLAAGCTPEINEEDYEDFSTYFLAALSGRTRTGKRIEKPDYDGDQVTSLTDAFIYVVLTSNTIDVPTMTSDQLLRDKSRFQTPADEHPEILTRDPSYETVLKVATPAQRACLEGLSGQLELSGDDRLARAREQASRIERDRRTLTRQRQRTSRQRNAARNKLRDVLAQRWPVLKESWKPHPPALLRNDLKQVIEFVTAQQTYKEYLALDDRVQDAHDRDDALEMKWVKLQRLLERAEVVVLAANADKVMDNQTIEFYRALLGRENRAWSRR